MALVLQRKQGISQSQLGRLLGVNTRDMSRAAKRLELRHKIHKTTLLEDGRWTYNITPVRSISELLKFSIEDPPDIQSEKPLSTEVPRAWTWQQGTSQRQNIG